MTMNNIEGKTKTDADDSVDTKATESQQVLNQIESLCTTCNQMGMTQLLVSKIPHFKDVLIWEFECDHCGFKDRQIDSVAERQDFGLEITFCCSTMEDLNRFVVKSNHATIRFVELDLEIPEGTQRGVITTIEGMLNRVIDELSENQESRRLESEEIANKIDDFINRIKEIINGKLPLTIILNDPSGNSTIQNTNIKISSNVIQKRYYLPTREQLSAMGFSINDDELKRTSEFVRGAALPDRFRSEVVQDTEQISISVGCPRCNQINDQTIKEIDIPGFRKCFIFSFVCAVCGYKTSEISPSAEIGTKGCRMVLSVQDELDLNRDILRSPYASISIPALEFETDYGGGNGTFTTVEGLLLKLADELEATDTFSSGDSADPSIVNAMKELSNKLRNLATIKNNTTPPFCIVLDDPADQSFIGSRPTSPIEDYQLITTYYERTPEMESRLGL